MNLDNQRESSNVEDNRTASGGGFGFPGGRSSGFGSGGGFGSLLPLLFSTVGLPGVIVLVAVYFALKMFTGIDLLNLGGGGHLGY